MGAFEDAVVDVADSAAVDGGADDTDDNIVEHFAGLVTIAMQLCKTEHV